MYWLYCQESWQSLTRKSKSSEIHSLNIQVRQMGLKLIRLPEERNSLLWLSPYLWESSVIQLAGINQGSLFFLIIAWSLRITPTSIESNCNCRPRSSRFHFRTSSRTTIKHPFRTHSKARKTPRNLSWSKIHQGVWSRHFRNAEWEIELFWQSSYCRWPDRDR